MSGARAAAVAAFLARHGLSAARREPLAGDASARRYERLRAGDGRTLILVDTPSPQDDLEPFIRIGALLDGLGLSVPQAIAADVDAGLALQEDFGDGTFSALLDGGNEPAPLLTLACDVLIHLHRTFDPAEVGPALPRYVGPALPRYDATLFARQAVLFAEVCGPVLFGGPFPESVRSDFETAWRAVLEPVCAGPTSLLLRDYHAGNLMLLPRDGLRAAGLIDFQAAGLGPPVYDLVSLLEDARRDVPATLADTVRDRYFASVPSLDRAGFLRAWAVLAAARHTRVLGIFVRLALAAGKRGYLTHLPRVAAHLTRHLGDPALAPVAAWFARHCPIETLSDLTVPETT